MRAAKGETADALEDYRKSLALRLAAVDPGTSGDWQRQLSVTFNKIGDMLVAAGFADPVMEMEKLTLTYDDVKAVMQDLRSIGAHNATAGRAPGMTGRQKWARIVQNYETLRQNGRLPATFEVIYGHAWKPRPKQAVDGRAIVKTDFRL